MKNILLSLCLVATLCAPLAAQTSTPPPATPAPLQALPPLPFATPAPRATPRPLLTVNVHLTAAQVTAYLASLPAATSPLGTQLGGLVPPALGIGLAQMHSLMVVVNPDKSWDLRLIYAAP